MGSFIQNNINFNNINADTVRDTKYEYMYVLKYPEEMPPENAEVCYMERIAPAAQF